MSQEHDTTKSRKCQHLNEAERQAIRHQLEAGVPKKQIAQISVVTSAPFAVR